MLKVFKKTVVCFVWTVISLCCAVPQYSWSAEISALTGNGFDAIATSSGTPTALSLSGTITTGSTDAGKTGSIFVVANVGSQWFFLNGSNKWVFYDGNSTPGYSNGTLPAQTSIVFLTGQNVNDLIGLKLYAGYGTTFDEMAAAKRYKHFYTITSSATSTGTGSITVGW